MSESKIAIVSTLDTKEEEVEYLKSKIEEFGGAALVIDVGMLKDPVRLKPDVTRRDVAEAGGVAIELVEKMDREGGERVMMRGLAKLLSKLHREGVVRGVVSIGGTDGSAIASAGMEALPIGVPKLMITSPAGVWRAEALVGTRDVMLINTVADVKGLNEVTRRIYDNAAAAIVNMVKQAGSPLTLKRVRLAALSIAGDTTPAVTRAKALLEEEGYETVLFVPWRTGSIAMAELVEEGVFKAVVDFTHYDVVDELLGSRYKAGLRRLRAPGLKGLPHVVVPGAISYLVFEGGPSSIPEGLKSRRFQQFNPLFVHVRASPDEMRLVGEAMASILNEAKGSVATVLALRGFSQYDREGEVLYDEEADRAFIEAFKARADPKVKIYEVDAHINDPEVAETAVDALRDLEGAKAGAA